MTTETFAKTKMYCRCCVISILIHSRREKWSNLCFSCQCCNNSHLNVASLLKWMRFKRNTITLFIYIRWNCCCYIFFYLWAICERLLSNNHTNSNTQTESVHFIVRNLTMIKSHKNGHNIKIIIPIYHPNRQSSSNDKWSICIQLFVDFLCLALLLFIFLWLFIVYYFNRSTKELES